MPTRLSRPAGAGNAGDGGDGGRGGPGGNGGPSGGPASSSAVGGGGAGGTIKLIGTAVTGPTVDTSGGGAGATRGGNGRFVLGTNVPGSYVATGGAVTLTSGSQGANPFHSAGLATPRIAGLLGGADVYGQTALTAPNFPSVVAGAHPASAAALLLLDVGPAGYADNYVDFDMLLYINLLNTSLDGPKFGAGAAGFSTALQQRGYTNEPLFGGAGVQTLSQLGAFLVYATLVPTGTTNYLGAFSRNGTTYSASAATLSYGVPLYIDALAGVAGTRINDGSIQRSIVTSLTVSFTGVVNFTGQPAAAFQLARTGPNAPTGNVMLAVDLSGSTSVQTIAKLTFSGAFVEGLANSLVDGNYTLTVFGSQITGGLQGGDYVVNLFRLYGDVNGDRTVNGLDLPAFRGAFGTTSGQPGYLDYLDANGDGAVNGLDLPFFRTRFGTVLP